MFSTIPMIFLVNQTNAVIQVIIEDVIFVINNEFFRSLYYNNFSTLLCSQIAFSSAVVLCPKYLKWKREANYPTFLLDLIELQM